jgi:hypothetical protein
LDIVRPKTLYYIIDENFFNPAVIEEDNVMINERKPLEMKRIDMKNPVIICS